MPIVVPVGTVIFTANPFRPVLRQCNDAANISKSSSAIGAHLKLNRIVAVSIVSVPETDGRDVIDTSEPRGQRNLHAQIALP